MLLNKNENMHGDRKDSVMQMSANFIFFPEHRRGGLNIKNIKDKCCPTIIFIADFIKL